MRCPKCQFISFDDLSTCANCTYDLSALSQELQGTCTETRVGFFLAPAIQTPDYGEEESFSESQTLPPIDDGAISFDDTRTGRTTSGANRDDSLALSLDESIQVPDDDVSIELGDIMPIDLDQLDSTQLVQDDTSFTETPTETTAVEEEIDLDLTAAFGDDSVELDIGDALSDIDFTETGATEATSPEDATMALDADTNLGDIDLTDTFAEEDFQTSDLGDIELSEPSEGISLDAESSLGLDEELLAELSETPEDESLDASAIEDLTGEFPEEASVEPAQEILSDTESEIEDLTGEFPALVDTEISDEELDVLLDDASKELTEAEEEIDSELSSLNLEDIDVSDLVTPSDEEADQVVDSTGDIDLTSLMDESSDDTQGFADDLDLDMLDDQQVEASPAFGNEDDDIPEIELVADDDDGGEEEPPDLPI